MVPPTVLPAVNDEEAPLQITAGVATVVITGTGFTVTAIVAVPVQPDAVPVTV